MPTLSKEKTAAGAHLSTKTADYLRDIQKVNTDQLVKLFDKTQSDGNVTVFGKSIAQVLGDGGSNRKGTTKVLLLNHLAIRKSMTMHNHLLEAFLLKRLEIRKALFIMLSLKEK